MEKVIQCPQCDKQTVYNTANPFRPFCSERCKLLDLGEWADEKPRIPGPQSNTNPDSKNSDDSNNI